MNQKFGSSIATSKSLSISRKSNRKFAFSSIFKPLFSLIKIFKEQKSKVIISKKSAFLCPDEFLRTQLNIDCFGEVYNKKNGIAIYLPNHYATRKFIEI